GRVAFSYVIGLFLLIGAGIVLFCSGIHTIGGFTLLPWEETRSQVADEAKQKIISYLSPYFFRKKK
ncbi:MAG: hypothetical protein ACXWC7_17700, partial [Chitinophagaceae bacterium]